LKITAITHQAKNSNRFNVFIDNAFAFGINADDMINYRISVGMVIDEIEYENLISQLEYAKTRDAAIRSISRSMQSTRQLQNKLLAKGFSTEAVKITLDLLTKNGYLDDLQYAKMFINEKIKINNYGKKRIIGELLQRGIHKDIITEVLSNLDNGQEQQAALRALKKKLQRTNIEEILAEPKEKNRIVSFMARRGFSYEIIYKAFRLYQNWLSDGDMK